MAFVPITSDDFSRLMAALGPFEPRPRLAVAVSGGADSLALALLAAEWAGERGGEAVALTVDHGLRAGSAAEAVQVHDWLRGRGIAHHTLVWDGAKPVSDLQAAAREARYGLLGNFCRDNGILHLLLAHHREDQAETLLLRLGRGSGLHGLAGMAPVRATGWGRLLRPLLGVPRASLAASLKARGQGWIEDPSNANEIFARVRLRNLAAGLAAEGLSPERLAETAGRLGRARSALDAMVAEAAARSVALDPAGFAICSAPALTALPEEVGLRLLGRLLLAVGGEAYGPRLERLERLYRSVAGGLEGARTLSGCRVVPGAGGAMTICREPVRVAPPLALMPGGRFRWDGRFEGEVAAGAPPGLTLGALGGQGWRKVAAAMGKPGPVRVPACARPTLPAIYTQDGIFAVPHLGYNREGAAKVLLCLRAAPVHVLAEVGFSPCAAPNRHYL